MQESIHRGLWLGIVLLGVFAVSAVVVYVVAGAAGSEGTGQLLVAAFLGPLIGSMVFGARWIWQQSSDLQEISDDK